MNKSWTNLAPSDIITLMTKLALSNKHYSIAGLSTIISIVLIFTVSALVLIGVFFIASLNQSNDSPVGTTDELFNTTTNTIINTNDTLPECYLTTEESCFPVFSYEFNSDGSLKQIVVQKSNNSSLDRNMLKASLLALNKQRNLLLHTFTEQEGRFSKTGLEEIENIGYAWRINPIAFALLLDYFIKENIEPDPNTNQIDQEMEIAGLHTFTINQIAFGLSSYYDLYIANDDFVSEEVEDQIISKQDRPVFEYLQKSGLSERNRLLAHYMYRTFRFKRYDNFVKEFKELVPAEGTYTVQMTDLALNPIYTFCGPTPVNCSLSNGIATCAKEKDINIGCNAQ